VTKSREAGTEDRNPGNKQSTFAKATEDKAGNKQPETLKILL
jgi:hypothetical protein